MGFPSKLKDLNYYGDGYSYRGIIAEVTVPKLVAKLGDWRGGGMLGEVPWTQGLEKLEMEIKLGGLFRQAFSSFGATGNSQTLDRYVAAFQDDDTGTVQRLEIVSRGPTSEIDMGNAKPGDDTEHTFKRICTYYKLIVDGEVWLEIDFIAGIFIVFGVDRYAEIRNAIGV